MSNYSSKIYKEALAGQKMVCYLILVMKKDIHPKTRPIVFKDISNGFYIITSSTMETKETIEVKGKTYPLVSFDVSSSSHPFYTGQQRSLDIEGRAERFKKKYKL